MLRDFSFESIVFFKLPKEALLESELFAVQVYKYSI
jgi:hypothetical protein